MGVVFLVPIEIGIWIFFITVPVITYIYSTKWKFIKAVFAAVLVMGIFVGPFLAPIFTKDKMCSRDSGAHIYKVTDATSYLLDNQMAGNADVAVAGISAAIWDVINGDYQFVEVQASQAKTHQKVLQQMGLSEHVGDKGSGVYKFFLGEHKKGTCVAESGASGGIADYKIQYELRKIQLEPGVCFGYRYSQSPTSEYLIRIYKERFYGGKKDVVDIQNQDNSEFMASYVTHYFNTSVVLMLITGDQRQYCPDDTIGQMIPRILQRKKFHHKVLVPVSN